VKGQWSPDLLDRAAFAAWMTALYAAIALPLYAAWRGLQRFAR